MALHQECLNTWLDNDLQTKELIYIYIHTNRVIAKTERHKACSKTCPLRGGLEKLGLGFRLGLRRRFRLGLSLWERLASTQKNWNSRNRLQAATGTRRPTSASKTTRPTSTPPTPNPHPQAPNPTTHAKHKPEDPQNKYRRQAAACSQ